MALSNKQIKILLKTLNQEIDKNIKYLTTAHGFRIIGYCSADVLLWKCNSKMNRNSQDIDLLQKV